MTNTLHCHYHLPVLLLMKSSDVDGLRDARKMSKDGFH